MNTDCFSNIARFLGSSQAIKFNTEILAKSFPNKITLKTFDDIHQFTRWCQNFNTSNLEEVEYSIFNMALGAPRDMVFGWVPPSVRVLKLSIYNDGVYNIPDTVEELCLDHCSRAVFMLPHSIRKLTLGPRFKGQIVGWPRNLKELVIQGWMSDVQDQIPLDNLPDSIHTMFLTWGTAVEVQRWPLSLEKLTIETCDDDAMANWLCIEHAPIPDGVDFTHNHIEALYSEQDRV